LTRVGFRSVGRTILTMVITVLIGSFYLFLMRAAALPLLVVLNGYVQVLSVSIAEVVVCWALVGVSFEWLTKSSGKFLSVLIGIVTATIFFSVYHIGHSAPFNQINMMLLLLVPGILTSLFYFISRELYATILFHNLQGTFGVLSNLQNPEFLNRPLYPLYFLLLLSVVAFIGAEMLLARRASKKE
jgi:hypothetical protein